MNLKLPHHFPLIQGAYIVGGSVRDHLLNKRPADYDIAVLENPEKYANLLAKQVSGRVIRIGKKGFEILRVVSLQGQMDVSLVQGASIMDDLARRDFTINAMAYDLASDNVIDPLGGRSDLEKKILRMASSKSFRNDPVRLVRAYRIGAMLAFTLDADTVSAITAHTGLIRSSAPERIRHELLHLLALPNAREYLSPMADTGLLAAMVPEFDCLRGCTQNRHHDGDVYRHTLRAAHHLENLINDLRLLKPACQDRMRRYLTGRKPALLKWAMLLHDIGKPVVRTTDTYGNAHFYDHPRKSADLAAEICRRLRFSGRDVAYTRRIVAHHMRPLFLYRSHIQGALTRKSRVRMYMACGAETPGVLLHALADGMGKKASGNRFDPFIDFINFLMDDFYSDFSMKKALPPLLTGHDLIGEFGLSPSPIFKSILASLEEARLASRLKDRADALQHVRKWLDRNQNKKFTDS